MSRIRRRVDRSRAAADVLGGEIREWLDEHDADPRFARFAPHFAVLREVLTRMLGAVTAALDVASAGADSGSVYVRCRELDRGLVVIRNTHEWYAAKYDQRLDARWSAALAAADEVVRSCWQQPFAVLGRQPPTGPLPYLEARPDAAAVPRTAVPAGLKPPSGLCIEDFVRDLPIPAMALPEWAAHEAWWLVLAAHETGHHVFRDLSGELAALTRQALGDVWAGTWGLEVFADAYSVLMVGEAAGWAIDELQHGPVDAMAAVPGPRDQYPPVVVRLALMSELARLLGARDDSYTIEAPALASYLAEVPKIAATLLDLRVEGRTLRELSGVRPDWFRADGPIRTLAGKLTRPEPIFPDPAYRQRWGARLIVAAGTAAGRGARADQRAAVHGGLVDLLAGSGPPGTMGTVPPPAQVDALADRLARRLVGP